MRLHIITTLLLAAPFAGKAMAQDTTQAKPPQDTLSQQTYDSASARLSDDMVLMRMHRTNQLEIRVGKLAQRNGSSAKVKSFGARLVRDHSASDQKVTALAKKLGISLAMRDGMDSSGGRWGQERGDSAHGREYGRGQMGEHDNLQQLATLRGAAFDTAFANAMVEGHQKAISMLEQAQPQVQRDEVRTLIANTLPTLRQHLQTAQSLSGGATTTSSIQQ